MSGATGSYNDGESAARREVLIGFTPDGLRLIEQPSGREVAFWLYEELRLVDEVFKEGPLRLRAGQGAARLTLADRALITELAGRAPQLTARARGWAPHSLRWAGLTVVSVAVLLGVLWFGLPRFSEGAARLVPVSWETALGEGLLEQVVRLFGQFSEDGEVAFCTAAPGSEALESLSGRLAAAAQSPYDFQVHVVNLGVPNAFALPGGQIVIFEGLLDFAQSPDEVAGVLAHEMGHVIHRHGTAGMIKSLGLAFFFGVLLGDLGSGAVGLAGETLVSLNFSREAEIEADGSALELLGREGLSSQGLADFFERLEQEAGGDMPEALQLLSTHPSHESRRQRFGGGGEASLPALSAAAWQSLREICGVQTPLG